MKFVRHIPAQPLSQFVDLFWLCQREALPHAKELALPTATVELVFEIREGNDTPVICGPHSRPFVIGTAKPVWLLGIHFKPGGAFPFLGLPAGELHNEQVSLETIWGSKAAIVQNQLIEARTPLDKFRVLEQALIAQATQGLRRNPAVGFALAEFHSDRGPSVSYVVKQTGLTPRRFIRLFQDEVGLTPKLYRRIHRFQRLLNLLHRSERVDWCHVALDCGYYDQAHCIHDFREFSSLSPTTYLRMRSEHLNHVPLWD
jgi:AraC-like DNA-binding protein